MKHLPRRFGPIASMSARSVRRRLMPSVSNACAPTVLQNTSSRASTLRSDLPSAPRDRLRSLSRSLPRSSRSRAERADGETGRDPARRRSLATAFSLAWLCTERSVPFGKYWRRRRLVFSFVPRCQGPVSYTHLRAHETDSYLVCRLLLE